MGKERKKEKKFVKLDDGIDTEKFNRSESQERGARSEHIGIEAHYDRASKNTAAYLYGMYI